MPLVTSCLLTLPVLKMFQHGFMFDLVYRCKYELFYTTVQYIIVSTYIILEKKNERHLLESDALAFLQPSAYYVPFSSPTVCTL